MVRQLADFETNIVSVERLKEYSEIDQEVPALKKLLTKLNFKTTLSNITFEKKMFISWPTPKETTKKSKLQKVLI